ncbi:MAG: hypothetical protein KDB03_15220, partial [Planctomycetales bacterium]|nr:hypothetical protein [Planctomycetales bacterium]
MLPPTWISKLLMFALLLVLIFMGLPAKAQDAIEQEPAADEFVEAPQAVEVDFFLNDQAQDEMIIRVISRHIDNDIRICK